MDVDLHGNVHIGTASGLETSGTKLEDSDGVCCDDVAVNQESYHFVSHHCNNGKLKMHKPESSFHHSIGGLGHPLEVGLDQSGAVFIADRDANRVLKY